MFGINRRSRSALAVAAIVSGISLLAQEQLWVADCNRNGIEDALDVLPRRTIFETPARVGTAAATDAEALTVYDLDGDGDLDIAAVFWDTVWNEPPSFVSVSLNRGEGSFVPGPAMEVRGRAVSPAAADLDGDGAVDLAVASEEPGTVTVFWGIAKGGTSAPAVFDVGVGSCTAIAAGDLDGDGVTDLVIPGAVLRGVRGADGTMSFDGPQRVYMGNDPVSLEAADLDGDGSADLAVANRADVLGHGSLLIFLSRAGGGGLGNPVEYPNERQPIHLALGDLNGDSALDIALAVFSEVVEAENRIEIYLNRGDASFRKEREFHSGYQTFEVSLGDLDGDGRLDLLVANDNFYECFFPRRASAFLGDGLGGFRHAFELPAEHRVRTPRIADFDGDGLGDIAWADPRLDSFLCEPFTSYRPSQPGSVVVRLNRSQLAGGSSDCDGDLVPDECAALEDDCDRNGILDRCETAEGFQLQAARIPMQGAFHLRAVDLDSDGFVDLAGVRRGISGRAFLVALLNGGARPALPRELFEVLSYPMDLQFADLDDDGATDALVLCPDPDDQSEKVVQVIHNGGAARFEPGPIFRVGRLAKGLLVADLDADGLPDLVTGRSDYSGFSVFWNEGGLGFSGPTDVNESGGCLASSLLAVDIDPNGLLDLICGTAKGAFALFSNAGGRKFLPRRDSATCVKAEHIAAADLDSDGDLDLVIGAPSGASSCVLLNSGGLGSFLVVDIGLPRHLDSLLVGNADGNSVPDLVVSETGGLVHVFPGKGDGTFHGPITYFSGGLPGNLVLADLDLDGDQDLVDGGVVLENAGGGHFLAARRFGPSLTVAAMASADFNGDGSIDLAVAPDLGHKLRIHGNDGEGYFADPVEIPLPADADRIIPGDVDGDGDSDILAFAGSAGRIFYVENRGSGAMAAAAEASRGVRIRAARLGDLDSDGALDVATLAGDAPPGAPGLEVRILAGGRNGAFSQAAVLPLEHPAADLALADFDGDGDLDVAVSAGSFVRILENRGGMVFEGAGVHAALAEALEVGHMDSDALPDIVSISESRRISILFGKGDGTFRSAISFEGWERYCGSFALADVDSDGDTDILLVELLAAWDRNGELHAWLNDGTGTFTERRDYGASRAPRRLVVFDATGDGRPDAAVGSEAEPLLFYPNGPGPSAARDANRNGKPDVCEQLGFHRGDADGDGVLTIGDPVFTLRYLFLGTSFPRCLDALDANDDGALTVVDAVYAIRYLFSGGPAPPNPGPPGSPCGVDPQGPGQTASLGCELYVSC